MYRKLTRSLNKGFNKINSFLSAKPERARIAGRVFMATALGIFLSLFLVQPLSMSTSAMFSAPEKRDFQMTDLFAQIADNRPVRQFDDRIVVVDIGRHSREEIAEGLSLLSFCEPKAVGIDINFDHPKENDELLLESLNSIPNLVLPLGVSSTRTEGKFQIEDKPFFFSQYPKFHYGVVNLPLSSEKGTVRDFAIDFPTEEGTLPSFVAAIAQAADPESVRNLKAHKSETGITSYHSKEYKTINLDEIEDNLEDLTDKIVLVGALDEASDMHATPVKSYVPGVMLHAYALSTILDGIWMSKVPKYVDIALAIGLCLLIMTIMYGFNSKFKGITLRFIQALLAYASVRIGYELFVDHNIIFDLSYTFTILAFGLFAVDIWNGIEATWNVCAERIKKLDYKLNAETSLC